MALKDYKYYIFDLDGTMVDTCPDLVETVQYIIKKYGYAPQTDSFIRSCIGGGARNVLLKSLGEEAQKAIDDTLLSVFAQYYTSHCTTKSKVYPDVTGVLNLLKQKGKQISVATFKMKSATEKIFYDFDLMKYFDIVITADDVVHPKPAPDCILSILDYYQCKPEEALLIGDTKTDYMTGVNAGIHVCTVTYGYNTPEQVRQLKADYTVNSMKELLNLL